jgi:membrane protease YdiL (CAAX protease family)
MSRAAARWPGGLLAAGVAAWLVGFAILGHLGSWTSFAVAGPLLALVALVVDREARALVRPTLGGLAFGLGAGVAMVLLTEVGFALAVRVVPGVREATAALYRQLNVAGFAPWERGALVAVIATTEEVVFRGAVLAPASLRWRSPGERGSRVRAVGAVVAAAALYGAATLSLGSPLLWACAFLCGVAWGLIRVVSGAVVAPVVAHVVWDLAVLIVWPLA